MLQIISFVENGISSAIICWGSSIRSVDLKKLTKLIKKAGSVLGTPEHLGNSITTKIAQEKICDQMKLLHNCWSELLVLEIVSRQVLYGIEGSLLLITGRQVELSYIIFHAGPAFACLAQRGTEFVERLRMLKVDRQEFACTRFLILFNPAVKELEEHQFVESVEEQIRGALLEYTLTTSSQYCNRFNLLLLCLSELRSLSTLAEEYLYCRHLSGEVPCNNLLNEMLHAKCNWT